MGIFFEIKVETTVEIARGEGVSLDFRSKKYFLCFYKILFMVKRVNIYDNKYVNGNNFITLIVLLFEI